MASTTRQEQAAAEALADPGWVASDFPAIAAARRRFAGTTLASDGALAPRHRELVAVVICAYEHDIQIETYMRRALAAGATVREIAEGLMAAATPGGQPCLHFAIPYLKVLIAELGEEANRRPAPGEEERARTHRHSTSGRWEWIEEHYPEYQKFRADVNRVLLMPEDATLAPRYRELMVAVILARQAYPTVLQHLRRAIEEGAAFDELVDAMRVAALFAGLPVLEHVWPILERIRAEIDAGALKPA